MYVHLFRGNKMVVYSLLIKRLVINLDLVYFFVFNKPAHGLKQKVYPLKYLLFQLI